MSSNSATQRDSYNDSSVSRPTLAYLGPAGTYTHQVYHTPKFTGLRAQAISYRQRTIDLLRQFITIPGIRSQVCAVVPVRWEEFVVCICQIDGLEQTCFIMWVPLLGAWDCCRKRTAYSGPLPKLTIYCGRPSSGKVNGSEAR